MHLLWPLLHDRAVLDPDEVGDAATIGLPVRTSPTPTRLRMFALSAYLDRHFRNRNEGTILKQETCS